MSKMKKQREKNKQALEQAIRDYGGKGKLADALKISRQSVYKWQQAPVERCRQLADVLGVKREDLRPEIFG
jgi:DNA-binding transcriptional regulator YdaS (Cro superfamily)